MNLNINEILNKFYIFRDNFVFHLKEILSSAYIRIYLAVILLLNGGIWLGTRHIAANIDNDRMALHYNVDFGIDYYGSVDKIYIIPFLGLVIILINFLLYIMIYGHKDRFFLSHLFAYSSFLSNIFLALAVITVYLINFR